jgi:hypothetical protein
MSSISPLSDPQPSPPLQQVQVQAVPVTSTSGAKPKSKPRKRVNTAEKRHQHNAIERARRETLNTKFLTLARLLPSLANHRRPSKSAIVNGSIGHVNKAREQRLLAASLLRQICRERDQLFEEVNEWRKASGVGRKEGSSRAWTDEMDQVCSVEQEVFGNFASMGGDDDGEDESDQVESMFAMPAGNGLITPRSSTTDIDPMMMFAQPHQLQQQQPAVNFQGMNWSQDFTNQFRPPICNIQQNPTPSMSSNTPLPFGAFMSDSTDSPSTSQLGNSIMLTPPTTADPIGLYTHTPSPPAPRPSSAGIDDKGPQRQNSAQQWTPQQLLFLQQIQQHQAQIRQHQQNLASHYTSFPSNVAGTTSAEGFTQSLIATMFPQQAHVAQTQPQSNASMGMGMGVNVGPTGGIEQVQQWRKAALTSFLQQHGNGNGNGLNGNGQLPMPMPDMRMQQPMLTPAMGMNAWSPENVVEGF